MTHDKDGIIFETSDIKPSSPLNLLDSDRYSQVLDNELTHRYFHLVVLCHPQRMRQELIQLAE